MLDKLVVSMRLQKTVDLHQIYKSESCTVKLSAFKTIDVSVNVKLFRDVLFWGFVGHNWSLNLVSFGNYEQKASFGPETYTLTLL